MGSRHFSFPSSRIASLLLGVASASWGAAAAPPKDAGAPAGSSEVTVSETFEKKFSLAKPSTTLELPLEQLLPPVVATPVSGAKSDPELERLLPMAIGVPLSGVTARPWLPDLPGPVAARFQLEVPKERKVKRWKLQISDSNGSLIGQIEKKGSPPAEVQWDGKTLSDQPVKVGGNYTYRLQLSDRYDRSSTYLGSSFELPALQYEEGRNLIIEIALDRLFAPKKAELQAKGRDLLSRGLQTFVESGESRYRMILYDDSPAELRKERSLVLRRFISPKIQISLEELTLTAQAPGFRGRMLQFQILR